MSTTHPDPDAPGAAPASPPSARPRHRPSVWWVLGPMLVLVAFGIATAGFAQAPYVMFAPGSARNAETRVSVPKSLSHQDPGEVLFTTVSVIHPTYLQAVWGWLRSDTDVFSYRAVYGDNTPTQNRVQGQADMRDSELVAGKVALEQLGYPVRVQGTGVTLTQIEGDVPAAKVLRAGDVVVGADGVTIHIDTDLSKAIKAHRPGDTMALKVERPGEKGTRTISVGLATRPGTADEPFLGVVLATRGLRFELPFHVDIDPGDVGGPSAGLAWTLALLDRLTPGSLTGGHTVAVTGAISPEGQVLEIGGVAQKVVAAKRAGAELFLVPTGEYAEAVKHAPNGLKVVKVNTLADALHALAQIGGNAEKLGRPGAP